MTITSLKPCMRCNNTELLRVHQVGWYFVKCHNCDNFGDTVIGKTNPDKQTAIDNWNSDVLDERFWQLKASQHTGEKEG